MVSSMGSLFGGAGSGFDPAENVLLVHDQVLLAAELDLGAAVGSEEHAVTGLDREGGALAVVQRAAVAHRDDLALARLLLGAVGQQDAAGGLGFGFDARDEHAVAEGTDRVLGGGLGLGRHVHSRKGSGVRGGDGIGSAARWAAVGGVGRESISRGC